jgi:hypothetical protein
MKTPIAVMSNINYYNKLIENKKAELDELINIRDKLVENFDQQKLALK